MIADHGGHGRCPWHTPPAGSRGGEVQTCMRRTEIVDGADQIHPMLQRQRVAGQRPAAANGARRSRNVAFSRSMYAVLITPSPLRAAPQCFDTYGRALDNPTLDIDHAPLRVSASRPGRCRDSARGTTEGVPACRTVGITKGLAHRSDVGLSAVGTDQQRTTCRTAPHLLDQSPDQGHVAVLADLTSQPQAGLDHHGQRHPHHAPLSLDAYLIGLHLSEVPRLFD